MNKTVGSVFLISGTAIGAGMLGLPLAAGAVGFRVAFCILVVIWLLMMYTGFLVLEVNLALPLGRNSFKSMAESTVGPVAGTVCSLTLMLLLYSLTGAYISGSGSMLSVISNGLLHWAVPHWVNSILFTLIFGGFIFHSTKVVDVTNQLVLSVKGVLIVITLALLMPKIQWVHLLHWPHHYWHVMLIAPIFLTSFGFHTIIPTITNYIGKRPNKLRFIILVGVTLPFLVYSLWLLATLGLIPQQGPNGFARVHHHDAVATLMQSIMVLGRDHWVTAAINAFGNIAMITSFLGVALGLFDFLQDALKISLDRKGRLQTALITFLPPLLFSFIYPEGFYFALSVAAIFVAILEIIFPVWMALSLRRSQPHLDYRVKGGRGVLFVVGCLGVLLIVLALLPNAV